MFCSNCGKDVIGKFCDNCGSAVVDEDISTTKQEVIEFNFGARKIYTTNVKIIGQSIIVVNSTNPQTILESNFADIVSVKTGLTPIINKVNIFRFVVAFALLFVPIPPVFYGCLHLHFLIIIL